MRSDNEPDWGLCVVKKGYKYTKSGPNFANEATLRLLRELAAPRRQEFLRPIPEEEKEKEEGEREREDRKSRVVILLCSKYTEK